MHAVAAPTGHESPAEHALQSALGDPLNHAVAVESWNSALVLKMFQTENRCAIVTFKPGFAEPGMTELKKSDDDVSIDEFVFHSGELSFRGEIQTVPWHSTGCDFSQE